MGVDLLARDGTRVIAVQAKYYTSSVGPDAVRQVCTGKQIYGATEAWTITNSKFTTQAQTEARILKVGLIDGDDLPYLLDRLGCARPLLTVPFTATQVELSVATASLLAAVTNPVQAPVAKPGASLESLVPVAAAVIAEIATSRKGMTVAGAAILLAGFAAFRPPKPTPEQKLTTKVSEWRSSILAKHPDIHSQRFYSDRIERFYLLRDIGQNKVASAWRTIVSQCPNIERFEIRNLKVELIGDSQALVVFDKKWRMSGRGKFEGAVRQQLVFEKKSPADWRIVEETEPKV